jgi:hypothetical protein
MFFSKNKISNFDHFFFPQKTKKYVTKYSLLIFNFFAFYFWKKKKKKTDIKRNKQTKAFLGIWSM